MRSTFPQHERWGVRVARLLWMWWTERDREWACTKLRMFARYSQAEPTLAVYDPEATLEAARALYGPETTHEDLARWGREYSDRVNRIMREDKFSNADRMDFSKPPRVPSRPMVSTFTDGLDVEDL